MKWLLTMINPLCRQEVLRKSMVGRLCAGVKLNCWTLKLTTGLPNKWCGKKQTPGVNVPTCHLRGDRDRLTCDSLIKPVLWQNGATGSFVCQACGRCLAATRLLTISKPSGLFCRTADERHRSSLMNGLNSNKLLGVKD